MNWADDMDKENLKSDMKVIGVSIKLESDGTRVYREAKDEKKEE